MGSIVGSPPAVLGWVGIDFHAMRARSMNGSPMLLAPAVFYQLIDGGAPCCSEVGYF